MEYKNLQRIAKETISYIKMIIKPNMNLLIEINLSFFT